MKKSDIAMIILIASISALIAFLIGNQLTFLKPDPKGVTIDIATPIESDIKPIDKKVFNAESINPTLQTVIGGSASGN